jgi:hypothetical protein
MSKPAGRFLHRLALALGKSLDEVRGMPAADLIEWQVYDEIEWLPDGYWTSAQVCAVLANVHRVKGRAFTIADFLRGGRRTKVRRTPEELVARFKAATAKRNGEGGA